MTKISNNKAKMGKGQKVKLGSNNAYEVYQNPATGQLEIIDTKNNSRALVDKEDRGQIGGNGTFIKALKNGEPMADTGKTYSTVQGAVDAASSWVFVPPGTYNESVTVETEGLTLRGAGYNSVIDGGDSDGMTVNSDRVTIKNLQGTTNSGGSGVAFVVEADEVTLERCRVDNPGDEGVAGGSSIDSLKIRECIIDGAFNSIRTLSTKFLCVGNIILNSENYAIISRGKNSIISSNIINKVNSTDGIHNKPNSDTTASDCIIIGNRIHNANRHGIITFGNDNIIANNRVSGSGDSNINDRGSNTVQDGNLKGSAN